MDSILHEMPAASGSAGPAPSEVQSQGQARGTAETSPLSDVQVCVSGCQLCDRGVISFAAGQQWKHVAFAAGEVLMQLVCGHGLEGNVPARSKW